MNDKKDYEIFIGTESKKLNTMWETEALVKDLHDSGEWADTDGWSNCRVDIVKRGEIYRLRLILNHDDMTRFGNFLGKENLTNFTPSILDNIKCLTLVYRDITVVLNSPISDEFFDQLTELRKKKMAEEEVANELKMGDDKK